MLWLDQHSSALSMCVFFSDEPLENRIGGEQFVELDSLDTEKALLLTDEDPTLEPFINGTLERHVIFKEISNF